MSDVPSNTPKRQAIVERLRHRIDCFRKRHDSCQARLDETQPSRELKQQQESRIFQSKILENKVKMNAKIRPDQLSKLAKQEESGPESKNTATANNTGLQAPAKRKFPNPQSDGERQNNEEISAPVPQKYGRFENQNDVHCNVKPNFNAPEESESPLSSNNIPYATVNGHATDFVKTEDLSNTNSSYSTSSCENIERTIPRVSQQYADDFATPTFTSRGQPSEKSRTPEFTGNFKQENGLLSTNNETSATSNGLLTARAKSEDDFRLLTDMEGNNATAAKEDDLKNQLSHFERVLQGIKSRDESSSETESSNDIGKTTIMRPHSQPLGNGLNDSPDITGNNQLSLPNNNTTQLPTSSAQQHGISRSTAQALQQCIMAQQNEKLASKVRFERNIYLNPQGEQNNPRMAAQRSSHNFAPVRQRVYQQLQQRKNMQLQKKLGTGATAQQLQARNPTMNPLGGNTAYSMHPKVRYTGIASTQQAVSSFTHAAGRMHQNLMQPVQQPGQQTQAQGQMTNLPRHQINMLAQQQQQQQQQKLAFQQQMASRLPTYSQAQHLARSSAVMDIRPKFAGVPATHATQYNPMQVSRAQQPLSHLQHYNPPGYGSQSGPPTRPAQVPPYSGDFSGYQHPYQYGQENKLHSVYQRHASMEDNLVTNRFHNPEMNQRNNFAYQRSSSLPSHAAAGGSNVFNQSSPPVVRLGQNEPNVPDMNNNGNEHSSADMSRVHPQAALSHMKQQHLAGQSNNLGMNHEQLYQSNAISHAQNRPQSTNLQTPLSNSFSNLLDMKSNSDTSPFPFLGSELGGGTTDNSDFDSLLKSPPSDFDLLNMLDEPQKALQ